MGKAECRNSSYDKWLIVIMNCDIKYRSCSLISLQCAIIHVCNISHFFYVTIYSTFFVLREGTGCFHFDRPWFMTIYSFQVEDSSNSPHRWCPRLATLHLEPPPSQQGTFHLWGDCVRFRMTQLGLWNGHRKASVEMPCTQLTESWTFYFVICFSTTSECLILKSSKRSLDVEVRCWGGGQW